MAADGMFFKTLANIHPRTLVPIAAIALQGAAAIAVMLPQRYDQILDFVTGIDYLFFGFAAIALFIYRARDARDGANKQIAVRMPGHPVTTVLFLAIAWAIVVNLLISATGDTLAGFLILLSGVPVYYFFHRRRAAATLSS
jgi:APA family basic amino acid/polyamine antiporter